MSLQPPVLLFAEVLRDSLLLGFVGAQSPAAAAPLVVGRAQHRNHMDESNQYTRATLLAGETVQRLQREGYSADEAKRLVTAVINAEEFALMKGRHSFDEARFSERLRQLPD